MSAAGIPTCASAPREAKHLAAVARTLQWADESADRGDLLDAIASLGTLEAIGDEIPRSTWWGVLPRPLSWRVSARQPRPSSVRSEPRNALGNR